MLRPSPGTPRNPAREHRRERCGLMPTVPASGSVSTRFPAHSTKPSTWRTRLCTPPNGAARERSPAFPPMRNGFNPFPSRNRRFPVPKGILHSFLKNPASARACKGNSHSVACLRDEVFCPLQRLKAPYAFGHGKAPAFDGAGRGRLPMGKLRGHSPVWWKTPRAAGPSESAASTRSEGKGPKAGQSHATARFPAAAYGFRRRVDGFLRKAPGARCVPHPIPSAPEGTGGSHILKKDIPFIVRALHRARTATTRERHQKWYIH